MHRLHRLEVRPLVALILVLTLAVGFVAACGDDDDGDVAADESNGGGGSVMAEAESFVDDAKQPLEEWPGPTEPVAAAGDKSVFIVSCGAQSEGCVRMTAGMVEAAKELGWAATAVEPQGTPEEINSAMQRAIDAGADAIIWQGFPRAILQESLAAAEAKGVVMVSAQTNEDEPNDISMDATREGEILGNFAISDSGGDAKVLMLTDREFPTLVLIDDAFKKTLARCSDCEVLDERDIAVSDLTTRVVPETVNLLQQHPDATHMYTPYDAMGFFAVQGVKEAGADVRMFSESGDAANLELIRNDDVFIATVGIPEEWIGWAAVDQTLRLLTEKDPVPHKLPLRLFTSDNVPDGIWEGDLDFRTEYRNLWGIG
jgi:ribose transport system substrate-binding protein